MSKISLKHSGGNVVSLNSPTSAPTSADVAFKLPNADGTSGQALVTDASGNLSFATVAGGKLLQTVTVSDSVRETSGSLTLSSANTFYETPFAVTITPSATSSKILLMGHVMGESTVNDYLMTWSIKRAISGGSTTAIQAPAAGSRNRSISNFVSGFYNAENLSTPTVVNFSGLLDSPNTTSAITYTFQVAAPENSSVGFYYNRTVSDTDAVAFERGLSWITAQEIAA